MMRMITAVLVGLLSSPSLAGLRADYSLETGTELRYYPQEAFDPQQKDALVSLRLEPEADWSWGKRRVHNATVTGFARLDSADDERSHVDLREAYYAYRGRQIELRAGVRRVFWGATESAHLVDIINQTDFVENPDGEDKLGQPMINLAWITDFGTVDLFALPYFRERTFAGEQGRLRFQPPPPQMVPCLTPPCPVASFAFDYDNPEYESADEQSHLDWALRWSKSFSGVDLGIAHFSGTARTPSFVQRPGNGPFDVRLVPFYGLIDQSSIDATFVTGGLLMKLEAIHHNSHDDSYAAAAAGFEYTFVGVSGSAWDAGLLMEYLWDERGKPSQAASFDNDLFVGTRLAGNDIAGTEILAGGIVDLDSQAVFGTVEASRRFGPNWKAVLELRAFSAVPVRDPLYSFSRDDYLSLEVIRYF